MVEAFARYLLLGAFSRFLGEQARVCVKVIGQIGIGLIVGFTLFYSNDVVVVQDIQTGYEEVDGVIRKTTGELHGVKSMVTNIPFFKNNEFDSKHSFTSRK